MYCLFEEVVWNSLFLQYYWVFVFLISWQNKSLMLWIRAPRSLGSWGRSGRQQLLRNSNGLQFQVRLARARTEILKFFLNTCIFLGGYFCPIFEICCDNISDMLVAAIWNFCKRKKFVILLVACHKNQSVTKYISQLTKTNTCIECSIFLTRLFRKPEPLVPLLAPGFIASILVTVRRILDNRRKFWPLCGLKVSTSWALGEESRTHGLFSWTLGKAGYFVITQPHSTNRAADARNMLPLWLWLGNQFQDIS